MEVWDPRVPFALLLRGQDREPEGSISLAKLRRRVVAKPGGEPAGERQGGGVEGVAFGGPDELMLKRIMGLTCTPAFPPVVDGGVKGWEALRRQRVIPGNG